MAIAPTGAIYKTITFDNVSSRIFGVYITGEAVFNAPEREVEMITIPGRNGAYALDNGRFENIEVTYPAGIFAETETDFAEAISDFRNFLCSKRGYVRLEDDYNPDEYRMAIYKSGLEVSPAQLRAGEFEITFECKPQRYLMSGDQPIEIANGDTIYNPTLFESSPMLEVNGYGDINIRDTTISIENTVVGDIYIGDRLPITFDAGAFNTGDYIRYKGGVNFNCVYEEGYSGSLISGSQAYNGAYFVAGTSGANTLTLTSTGGVWSESNPSTTYSVTVSLTTSITYDGADYIYDASSVTVSGAGASYLNVELSPKMKYIIGQSTVSTLGNPTYIDLETGEAYKIENGTVISLNHTVSIPAKLPTLLPGPNKILFGYNMTKLQVIPRWWKV